MDRIVARETTQFGMHVLLPDQATNCKKRKQPSQATGDSRNKQLRFNRKRRKKTAISSYLDGEQLGDALPGKPLHDLGRDAELGHLQPLLPGAASSAPRPLLLLVEEPLVRRELRARRRPRDPSAGPRERLAASLTQSAS